MDGFNNLPCLNVSIASQGLNGTVILGKYTDFTIQSNNRDYLLIQGIVAHADCTMSVWTVTYYVDPTYSGIPTMEFDLTYTC